MRDDVEAGRARVSRPAEGSRRARIASHCTVCAPCGGLLNQPGRTASVPGRKCFSSETICVFQAGKCRVGNRQTKSSRINVNPNLR